MWNQHSIFNHVESLTLGKNQSSEAALRRVAKQLS
jgi:hypothetical protein